MSRNRRGNGPFVAKKAYAAKAIDMGSSDASILAGTMADANFQAIPDSEQYWMLFKKHPYVRACVRLIANAVAQEGYDLAPIDGADVLDENSENVLMVNEFMRLGFIGRYNTFRKWVKATTIDVEVFGWAFCRKKYALNALVGLERLDPRMITPKLNENRTEIIGFAVKAPNSMGVSNAISQAANEVAVASMGVSEIIPPDEVIMFSLDEGGDSVLGAPSPLEALDLTLAIDFNVRQQRNAFFRNGAQIGNAFIFEDADENQVRAAEKQINSLKVGARNSYKNLLLAGNKVTVHALQQQGRNDLDFIKGSELLRDEVCAVYSVPPGKIVFSNGALGSAGKSEDDETFEQDCVLPLEENIYETLTFALLQTEFGIEDLQFIPKRRSRMRLERIEAASKLVTFGGTGNEARDMVGLPKIEDPQFNMDVPLFLQHSGVDVVNDEPRQAPTQSQPADNGNLEDAVDAAANEVGQKAGKRFRQDRTASARKSY